MSEYTSEYACVECHYAPWPCMFIQIADQRMLLIHALESVFVHHGQLPPSGCELCSDRITKALDLELDPKEEEINAK